MGETLEQIGTQIQLIEARYASGTGGHRFWLFIFNLLATSFVALWLSFTFGGWVPFACVSIIFLGFLRGFDVDGNWKKISAWRRKARG